MGSSAANLTAAQLQALLNGPAGPPPPGVTPNFVNPPNHTTLAIAVMTVGLTASTLVLLMRIYTKVYLIRSLALEDYTIGVAWIGAIAYSVLSGINCVYGSGTHIWDVQLKTFFTLFYWVNLVSIVYGPVIFLIKLSILLQYLRIFRPTRQGNMFLYVGVQTWIWLIFIFYFLQTMVDIFQCVPRARIWNPLMTTGHCLNANAGIKASGIFNVVSDFAIFSLPIPCIWKLKIPLRKKLGIIAIFTAGFVACIASIFRAVYSLKLTQTQDFTYEVNLVGFWALTEVYIGYIVSCLPQSPRFYQFVAPKIAKNLTQIAGLGKRISGLTGRTTDGRKSGSANQPLAERSASGAWNDLSKESGAKRYEYLAVGGEEESKRTEKSAANDTIASIYDGYFGRSGDLEKGGGDGGGDGIMVEHVTQVESVLPPPRTHGRGREDARNSRHTLWV